MGKVISEISMSLDGFVTGPNVRVGNGMGDEGDRLHDWKFDAKTETEDAIVDEIYASTGAVLIGKRMFDVGFEPWGDPPPFGMPVFIVTHEQREPLPMQGGTTYTFVTHGIEAALELARAAAGDKNVGIWGGANVIRQYLKAGLLDEMQLHLIPMLLGGGLRLFDDLDPEGIELRRTSSIETPGATHFRFEVVKGNTYSLLLASFCLARLSGDDPRATQPPRVVSNERSGSPTPSSAATGTHPLLSFARALMSAS
jgi:dihydrofolate reductase